MTILFSPIGLSDPMTDRGDGPMLRIVRIYQPDEVVLFLSPEIARYQALDSRYTKAIELLVEATGQKMPEITIFESKQEAVHVHDYYIDELELILNGIAKRTKETILLNASSGTPAMQQALVALAAFGRMDLKTLQVEPRPTDLTQKDVAFDLSQAWDRNPDNHDPKNNAVSRILAVPLPNFSDRLQRENIIALIKEYDYAVANRLAQQVSSISPDTLEMIAALEARLNLDGESHAQVFNRIGFPYDPANQLAEYLYMLEVRLDKEQWADFIRAISPAIQDTFIGVLRPFLPESKYLKQNCDGTFSRKNDRVKIRSDERLNGVFKKAQKNISNYMLKDLVNEYFDSNVERVVDTKQKLSDLRELEKASRNQWSHEITKVDKTEMEKKGGLSLEKALAYLFELNDVKPGLYDSINELVLSKL